MPNRRTITVQDPRVEDALRQIEEYVDEVAEDVGSIEDGDVGLGRITTDEEDTTLVLSPDGAGRAEFVKNYGANLGTNRVCPDGETRTIQDNYSLIVIEYLDTEGSGAWDIEEGADIEILGGESGGNQKFLDMKEPTGFVDRADSLMSFVNGSMTFTIQPAVDKFEFYIVGGAKITKTGAENIIISDDEGLHYIYYDSNGALQESITWDDDFILTNALVTIIYWDTDNNQEIYLGDERHGITMDGADHLHFHLGWGTKWYSGLSLNGFVTDGDGDDNVDAQFGHESGVVADEDIKLNISADTSPAVIPIYYKLGSAGNWRKKTADNFPMIYDGTAGFSGTGRAPYNQWTGSTWQLTEVINGRYFNMLYFATTDTNRPVIGVQGQAEYNNLNDARDGLESELDNLVTTGLPFVEFTPLGGIVCQTSNGYANTPQTRIRELADGSDYLDLRAVKGASTGGVSVTPHATTHVDGDSIRDATNALKGLATASQITDLEANTANRKIIEQYIRTSLTNGSAWDITHSGDATFDRFIQVFKDIVNMDGSLDFDSADESLFYQEDSSKTTFAGDKLALEGVVTGNVYSHWKLNKSSGTDVADSSGNGRDGTTLNMEDADWVTGKLNNCLRFDGVNEFVDFGNIAGFERDEPFSVECWFKTSDSAQVCLVSRMDSSSPYKGWEVGLLGGSINIYLISSWSGNAINIKTTNAFHNNLWHHLVFTYDGSSTCAGCTIYVDNVSEVFSHLKDTLSTSIVASGVVCALAGRNATIIPYEGDIDEVVIYSEELGSGAVTYRWNSGAGREDTGGFDVTQGWMVRTNTNQIDTSLWGAINSIDFTQTTPTGTQLKYLISVDGRTTWKRWTGSAWVTETLTNLHTNGNTKAELEALDVDDWDLIFVAGTLDGAFGLKTTDNTETPELDQITANYKLVGKRKCKDSEIDIDTISATESKITNNSGGTLENLRAVILL